MKTLTNFTTTQGTTPQRLATIARPNRDSNNYVATVLLWGTFGSGTLALFVSPDNGTTLIPLTSSPGGTAISFTALGMVLLNFGHTNRNTDIPMQLWGTLTGATAQNLNVGVYDNVG